MGMSVGGLWGHGFLEQCSVPTLQGFHSACISEPDNFLDQLLGDSGALEVLMASVGMCGWGAGICGWLFNSQMVVTPGAF